MADESEHPVLYLTQRFLFLWDQHAPGGCRCVCRMYHCGSGTCQAPAEPGRLLRVIKVAHPGVPGDITDGLALCAACYTAIAPLNERPPSSAVE